MKTKQKLVVSAWQLDYLGGQSAVQLVVYTIYHRYKAMFVVSRADIVNMVDGLFCRYFSSCLFHFSIP
jgi:hypothetical protein